MQQNQQDQQIGPQPFTSGISGPANQDMQEADKLYAWPHIEHVAQGLDLNELPQDPLIIDLNALADMQEVIIDPMVIF
jgi:hypothetical protein